MSNNNVKDWNEFLKLVSHTLNHHCSLYYVYILSNRNLMPLITQWWWKGSNRGNSGVEQNKLEIL